VPILLFADDIVLLAPSASELQKMLDAVSKFAAKWQFRLNTKDGKSNVVVSPHSKKNLEMAREAHFHLADGELTVSMQYKYLGVESGKTGKGCWNAFLSRVTKAALGKVNQLVYAATAGNRPLRIDTAVHIFDTWVRPSLEYASGLWGAMLSSAGVNTLEGIQSEFGKRLLKLGGSKVAHAYVTAELGLWPVALRAKQACLLLFGSLCSLPRSRLAAHVFRNSCNDVDKGRGKFSWCKIARGQIIGHNFDTEWSRRKVAADWSNTVHEICSSQLWSSVQAAVRQKSTLQLFADLKPSVGVEPWLKHGVQHPGAQVKLRLRSGCAPLMLRVGPRNGIPEPMRVCPFCDDRQLESEEHVVSSCSLYSDLRERCMARLRSIAEPAAVGALPVWLRQPSDTDLVDACLGSKCWELPAQVAPAAEQCVQNYLRLLWARRSKLWARVCRDGDEWRL
jgi:hypothetical protein